MTICPHCQVENRVGAKFCKDCAKPLPISPKTTIPLKDIDDYGDLDPAQPVAVTTSTQPLPKGEMIIQRPIGAIFADQFVYSSLVYSNETQVRYLVTQLNMDPLQSYYVCSNPLCGAFYSPGGTEPDKYCTDCGSDMKLLDKELVLIETTTPPPEYLLAVIAKNLTHGSVRAPLAAFEERLNGVVRYCMILPHVSTLETQPNSKEALLWGVDLAYGLDYLHDNGIVFQGQIDQTCFALEDGRVLWANFTCDHLTLHSPVIDRRPDVISLAKLIYHWITGQIEYEPTPSLIPAENQVFETALTGEGFSNALEFALALEGAREMVVKPSQVDYRLGRRTHVGMVRTLNEDSMLTLELNRTQQSLSQPVGFFAVADGMGGHTAGEIASRTIVTSLSDNALSELFPLSLSQEPGGRLEWLRHVVQDANSDVYNLRKTADTDMGSTLVAAVLEANQAHIAHVGDSRAYIVSRNEIKRITTDHSLVERLISTNQITREEARHHPQRNVIYRTIGDKGEVDVEVSSHSLNSGEYLLLCSDGLTGMVEDREIHRIIMDAQVPQAACDQLIDAANAAGGDDNITAIIIQVVKV